MKGLCFTALLLFPLLASAVNAVQPIDDFEIDRYLGKWYEIARTDNRFERNLTAVRAHYSLRDDGKVRVINAGYSTKENKWKKAEAKGKFEVDPSVGHLNVSFFWIFYSDYIVYEIGPNYDYAFVSGDSPKYLWLLSRSQTVSDDVKARFAESAKALGVEPAELIWVDHANPDIPNAPALHQP